jgi:hypothetical protein
MSLVYTWTANGTLASMTFPEDLRPAKDRDATATRAKAIGGAIATTTETRTVEEATIEPFIDNLRRTVSAINQYIEIPFNNVLSTGNAKEPLPVFKFILAPNKRYKLNILIRARTEYRYTVPILAKYTIETNSPGSFMDYRATYVSSNETAIGTEKNSSVLGAEMQLVVDSKLSLLRFTATFQTNAVSGINGVELRLHHGIQTDDPDAKLYALDGSYGVLSEVIPL